MNLEKIGQLILNRRKLKGYTQEELGNKLGVGGSSVSKWERGLTAPDISILPLLAKELGINIDELLSGNINPKVKQPLNKKYIKIAIIIIIMLLSIFILCSIFIKNEEIFLINSNNDFVSFSGHAMIGKNNCALTINNFKFLNKDLDKKILYYKLELSNEENTLVEYSYDNFDNMEQLYLSKAIEKSFIELIDENININQLKKSKLVIEYIDESEKNNKKDLNFIIEKQ